MTSVSANAGQLPERVEKAARECIVAGTHPTLVFDVVDGDTGGWWPSASSITAKRRLAEMLKGLFGLKISEGAIANMAAAEAVCRVRANHHGTVRNSPVIASGAADQRPNGFRSGCQPLSPIQLHYRNRPPQRPEPPRRHPRRSDDPLRARRYLLIIW
jgi:hypothetical protein